MSKCELCRHRNSDEGWVLCEECMHEESLRDLFTPMTNADRIRAMTDEELAKLFADYTSMLYEGEYVPSDEAISEITQELLRQLQQPYESPTGQKG